jgi:hypothetical protein
VVCSATPEPAGAAEAEAEGGGVAGASYLFCVPKINESIELILCVPRDSSMRIGC